MYKQASFLKRLSAGLIDIFSIILIFTISFCTEINLFYSTYPGFYFGNDDYFELVTNTMVFTFIAAFFFYCFGTETSKWQGSLGKKILKLKVVSVDDNNITWKQAFLRTIFKFFAMFIYITYLSVLFTKTNTTFYDYILGTKVVEVVGVEPK